jgi:hypothetical protein
MQLDIRAVLRKILVAGLPLAPVACGRDPLIGGDDGGARGLDAKIALAVDVALASCVGEWKAPATMCGLPETELLLLDPTDGRQQRLYDACAEHGDCLPLCQELRPAINVLGCEPACDPSGRRGARLVRPPICYVGRMTEGVAVAPAAARVQADGTLGAQLAELAALEGASVPAFRRLARELAVHGAPGTFVIAARRSAFDEVAHHAAMSAAAAHAGTAPGTTTAAALETRSLAALARENAVEGCARETFGALLACWQAATARDPALRRLMTGIAADETAHAALGWRIHAWASERLGPGRRRALRDELHDAFAELEAGAATPTVADAEDRRAFGLPEPETAVRLVRALGRAVVARA